MTTKISSDNIQSATLTQLGSAVPKILSLYYTGIETSTDPAGGQTITINGSGFNSGAIVYINSNVVSISTVVNSTQITFTAPATPPGTYPLYVVNTDGGTAIYAPGISYSGVPTWSNAAGSLGSQYEYTPLDRTLIATGDQPITYTLVSGSLPPGATLFSNGVITGTAPASTGSTTYSFTIRARDVQNQDTTRSFSLTIDTDVVTWNSPADSTLYTTYQNKSAVNVALDASSAAGFGMVYSANTLPNGLSVSGNTITGTPTTLQSISTLLTATANSSGRFATRTISWIVILEVDDFWKYTSTLLTANSAVVTSSFVNDASPNTSLITVFGGNARPQSFDPYSAGYYSNYFDGTTDYLQFPSGDWTLPGDFTIEAWVNLDSPSTGGPYAVCGMVNAGSWFDFRYFGNQWQISFNSGSGTNMGGTGTVVSGTWAHVAAVRSGSSVKVYVNGVETGTTITNSSTLGYSGLVFYVGYSNTNAFKGYISNFRLVKGTALYTANFTPTTSTLTSIANTKILTAQSNSLVDNSPNAYAITKGGDVAVRASHPFMANVSYATYGSGYFSGSGDYLTVPYSSSFNIDLNTQMTYECWVYPTTTGAFVMANRNWAFGTGGPTWGFSLTATNLYPQWSIAGTGSAQYIMVVSTIAAKLNQWNHVAFSRDASNLVRVFVNGVLGGSRTDGQAMTSASGDIFIGNPSGGTATYANGYMSDMRLVIGSCVYAANTFTPPTATLSSVTNTKLLTLQNNGPYNNSTFNDKSNFNNLITRYGNATAGTFTPYGNNWSIYCNNNGYVTVPASANYPIGTNDFTMEFWMFPTISGTNTIMASHQTGGMFYIVTNSSNNVSFSYNADGGAGTGYTTTTTAGTYTVNAWNHIVASRVSGTVYFYINGTRDANSWAASGINIGSYGGNKPFYLGAGPDAGAFFTGYLSNYRYIRGTGIYSGATITVPTTPLTWVSGTAILTLQSNRFVDNSLFNATLTTGGTAPTVQKFSPFSTFVLPTYYSTNFNGSSDYLTLSTSSLSIITGDFTVECWIYATANNKNIYATGAETSSRVVFFINGSNQLCYDVFGVGTTTFTGSTVTLNTWTHVAWVRSVTTVTAYINGTSVGTSTLSGSVGNGTQVAIGVNASLNSGYWSGYISNLRVTKQALYTTAFTPSTAPLTTTSQGATASNVSLLTCQSSTLIDNSPNYFAITAATTTVKPLPVSPFTPVSIVPTDYSSINFSGSTYFDGTGDYLGMTGLPYLGTGNFTIDGWVYNTGTVTNNGVFSLATAVPSTSVGISLAYYSNGSGWQYSYAASTTATVATTLLTNTWYHFAFSRSSGTLKVYINGAQIASVADTTNYSTFNALTIGGYYSTSNLLKGYISDMRIIPGVALYTSAFYPGESPSTASGTKPGTTTSYISSVLVNDIGGVVDVTRTVNFETVAGARITTSKSPYAGGGISYYFDGTGDYLSAPSIPPLNFGTGSFTIEGWVYFNSLANSPMLYHKVTTNSGWFIQTSASIIYFGYGLASSGQYWQASVTLTTGTWYHIAVTRVGAVLSLFLNGTKQSTTLSGADTSYDNSAVAVIGSYSPNNSTYDLNGYIADFRITRGYARYSANFTPPTKNYLLS